MSKHAPVRYPFKETLGLNCWIKVYDGSTRVAFKKDSQHMYIDYTAEQLADVDARLPTVIGAMAKKNTTRKMIAPTDWVSNTLDWWVNPFELRDISGGLHQVKELRTLRAGERCVVTAQCYRKKQVAGIDYIEDSYPMVIAVRPEELERHFPGWHARYTVLSGIVEAEDELARLVLTNNAPQDTLNTKLPEM